MLLLAAIAIGAFLLGAMVTGMFASFVVAGLHHEAQSVIDSYMGTPRPKRDEALFPAVSSLRLRHAND
ncbi:hypothetical protein L6Q21_09540 [Sandaracinobacter sp. RS1-74]|uniref:hypothetical protein n=1 Tax=Sandaracinobacteroides sayramensis TaxID=2913411 RepID=UPI001EDBC266|nr:hypothetical protein [Sandaracinobacteroides sayramensis]MCG2841221.1 hypothetical protein [Sandaracinobacteroides sayramensis]